MNTKKTLKLLFSSLAMAGCFMTVQQAAAQSWGNGSGNSADRWTVNDDNSNHWSYLRLQTDNDRAWNMVNQQDLWWGYAANSNHNDRGSEKMRLTTGQGLIIRPQNNSAEGGEIRLDGAGSYDYIRLDNYVGRFRVLNETSELLNVLNNGNVGIGTNSPQDKLHVAGDIRMNSNHELYFADNGQIRSNSDHHRILFRRTENIMELREYGDIVFSAGATSGAQTSTMFLNNDGNVGIGTTSPSSTLHVKDDGGNQVLIEPSSNTGQDVALTLTGHRNASTTSNNARLYFSNYDNDLGTTNSLGLITGRVTNHGSNYGDLLFYNFADGSSATETMRLTKDSRVGIGITSPTEKLEVSGNIKADGVILNIGSFPDYVFEKDYPLMPLSQVEKYIKTHKHLPGFPSEAEVVKNGASLGELNKLLVEKVEELTLHSIAQEKQINMLLEELTALKARVKALKKQ